MPIARLKQLLLKKRAKVLATTTERSIDNSAALDKPTDNFADLSFPALPPVALQILQLSISNEHSTRELVELISQDSTMQQQVMFYTQLPFIQEKFRAEMAEQEMDDVQHVVDHILGFDMVSHIALGVAAGRAFNLQRISGLEDFWRHAFYAASYAERITELVAERLELDPAISYMAGLFHNFGLLLFSQMYPPEYGLLKKWIALNPKVSISVLEQRVLGMGHAFTVIRNGHAQLGEWLLRSWQMPESICVITREHHSLTYKGKYVDYVRIIQLTNQLLRADGIGDGTATGISDQLLEALGLTAHQVYKSIEQVKAGAASIDNMARSLTNSA
ncbi:MAG TPA: HDOD domain-containing protein [Gammaproteobacteria bacterium]|nr:HDOD domain-containing protein [Gammaproteobacteria bacterium]